MARQFDLILRGGTCVLPDGIVRADVGILAGRSAAVGDLAAHRRIEGRWIESRCGSTPFHGHEVQGWPIATIVRGQIGMREETLLGEPVEFHT